MLRLGVAFSALLAVRAASAQPGFVAQPVPAPEPTTAQPAPPPDVDHAPLPGHESGRTDDLGDGDTPSLDAERIALTPVRWLAELALTPVHAAITVWAHHRMSHQIGGLGDGKGVSFSVEPLLRVDSGHGIAGFTGGARVTVHDLLGEHEAFAAAAGGGAGGYLRQIYGATLRSGHRLGDDVELALSGSYEDRPRDGFYGIGDTPSPVERFAQRRTATGLAGDVRITDDLHVVPSASLASDGYTSPIDGMARDASSADAALELRWDSEVPSGAWDPRWLPTSGTFAAVAVGRSHRLDAGPDFWRARVDVEQLVRLGIGPRILAFRLHGEGVSTADVPLPELPALGGPAYLRGYALDEFRDRLAAVATVEYRWDLAEWLGAHVFVDAGRVAPALDAFALDGVHVGYGGGVVLGRHGAVLDLASTLDGGFMLAATIGTLPATAAAR